MTSGRVRNAVLLAYALPGLPLAVLGLPLYIYLPTFYAETVGVDLATIGLVLLSARLWDVVTDPVVGILSDRTKSKIGRRRSWVLASLPILCLSIYFLFVPPRNSGSTHLLLASMALYLGWTMFQLPYSAWGAELSDDYHERSRVTAAREVCVIVGTLMAAALPTLLPADQGAGLGTVLWVLALTLIVTLPATSIATCIFVPDKQNAAPVRRGRLGEGFAAIRRNRPFRLLIVAYLLNGIANGLPATLFLLFVSYVLEIPSQAGPLLFIYFLSAIIGVPIWVWVSRRLDKHRSWIIAMALTCLVFAWAPFLGPGDFTPFLAICVLSGLCLGADLALPPSMQADVVDIDTAETGTRRTGLYFALWGMATKLALAIAVGVSFPLLDLAGFQTTSRFDSDRDGLLTLALLYGGLPIVFKISAMALMARFPKPPKCFNQVRQGPETGD
ncbi:MAG: MFS transporter [Rhodospirillaceae bacterium]|nr:MFS transporter [Rhodospirillaceae bacterium]